ncbi:MAG: TetR/AcrR family transcriptional regulator [Actinobacteria bacterium]|nr:TetR/AcrR family transcriptional regulator [Actinomycetota bacterium]
MSENVERPQRKPDRRVRRTRAALQQALLQLIREKPYASITIEAIADAAGVARPTVYAHYKDKEALLLDVSGTLLDELEERADARTQERPNERGAGLLVIFGHVEAHKELYRVLLRGEGGYTARLALVERLRSAYGAFFDDVIARRKTKPRVRLAALTTAWVGALMLHLEAVALGELEGSYEERAATLANVFVPGAEWALGLPAGTLFD